MTMSDILNLVMAILTAVLTFVLIPWIRSKTDTEQRQELADNIKIAVQAAEQLYTGSGKGTEKKLYVRKWLADRGVNFEDGEVWNAMDAMIESAVLELKKGD